MENSSFKEILVSISAQIIKEERKKFKNNKSGEKKRSRNPEILEKNKRNQKHITKVKIKK